MEHAQRSLRHAIGEHRYGETITPFSAVYYTTKKHLERHPRQSSLRERERHGSLEDPLSDGELKDRARQGTAFIVSAHKDDSDSCSAGPPSAVTPR